MKDGCCRATDENSEGRDSRRAASIISPIAGKDVTSNVRLGLRIKK